MQTGEVYAFRIAILWSIPDSEESAGGESEENPRVFDYGYSQEGNEMLTYGIEGSITM